MRRTIIGVRRHWTRNTDPASSHPTMSKRKAEDDDPFAFLQSLEAEVQVCTIVFFLSTLCSDPYQLTTPQAEKKKPIVSVVTSKPVMTKRVKEDVTVHSNEPAPPAEVEGWSNSAPVPPPPSLPAGTPYGMDGTWPEERGIVPPPPPSYQSDHMTMPDNMVPSRPAPNPVLPVPKQYQANQDGQNSRPKTYKMSACGSTWEDPSLHDWPEDDHRIFVGDLGNECNDDLLAQVIYL